MTSIMAAWTSTALWRPLRAPRGIGRQLAPISPAMASIDERTHPRRCPGHAAVVEEGWAGVSESGADDPVVVLSDDTVTLRPWLRDDATFLADASADPAIRRYNGVLDRQGHQAPPLSTRNAETVIQEFATNWRAFAASGKPSGVAFAITDARSGALVGCCGVDNWSQWDVAQFGYWIAPGARRRGYATRAAILLTRWLFELGAARVFLTITAGNEPSIAVARRAGFAYEGSMRSHAIWQGQRYDVLWFAALPHEWELRTPLS